MTKPLVFERLYTSDPTDAAGEAPRQDGHHHHGEDQHLFPSVAFDDPRSVDAKAIEATYTAEDLAAAIENVRQTTTLEVEQQTRMAMTAEVSHRQSEALEAIRAQLGQNEEALSTWMSETIVATQSLAKIMGQAIVPKALELHPLADIADMIRQALSRLVDQPSIELRVEEELVAPMNELLGSLAEETGFLGELLIIADPSLSPGDARLVWKNGVAVRDLKHIQEETNAMIDAWLGERSGDRLLVENAGGDSVLTEPVEPLQELTVIEHQSSEERSTS